MRILASSDLRGAPESYAWLEATARTGRPDADDMAEVPPRPGKLIPIHGRRWDMPPHDFVGYRYGLPFIGRETEKPEADIERDLSPLRELVDDHTTLVTHSPPFGILDLGILDRHAGSASGRKRAALLDLATLTDEIPEDL